ncbi:MAG: hypothetical protein WC306_03990 [Candidatus Paceibacterota bacterium]|jgi:hypothetical protein
MSAFTSLDPATDKKENSTQIVTTGLWDSGNGTLSTFFTASADSASVGKYYTNVYAAAATESVQFSIAFGSYGNSGSVTGDLSKPAKSIYSQYGGSILTAGDSLFTVNGIDAQHCVFLNVQRARYKEKINRGNWQLTLSASFKGAANGFLYLIDNSSISGSEVVGEGGKGYHIVSGSYSSTTGLQTIHNSSAPIYYGLFYPDIGMFVLDATALTSSVSSSVPVFGMTSTDPTSADGTAYTTYDINNEFFKALKYGGSFIARSEENVKNSIYFVRVKNRDYNYSTNPTYFDSAGNIKTEFINDPKSYITSVGLYNDNDELIAIAKLSMPILKSQDRELLLKCKLDF